MASVRKRQWKSKTTGKAMVAYVVDYRDQEGVRRTPQFEKKHQADEFKRKVEREIFEGIHTPSKSSMRFGELCDLFLQDCDRRRKIKDRMSGNTWRLTSRLVSNHVAPAFALKKVNDITSKDVRDFVNGKCENYGRVTVIKLVSALRAILQFAVQEGFTKRNIVRDDPPRIPLPMVEQREIPSLAELRRLVETIESVVHGPVYVLPGMRRRMSGNGLLYAATMTYLALTGGMRIGEICGLQWENVDFTHGVIRIRHSKSRFDGLKGPKSKAGIRDVPMVPTMRSYLMKVCKLQGFPQQGYVMRTITGSSYEAIDMGVNLWRPVARAAGLVKKDGSLMGLHAIRHAAASLWIKAKVSDLALKRAIGHSSFRTTMDVYGHLFADDQSDVELMISSVSNLIEPQALLPTPINRGSV